MKPAAFCGLRGVGKPLRRPLAWMLLTWGCLMAASSTAAGAVYFVSPAGDDAGPGTVQNPWRTIGKAAETAVAGDTVWISEGVYRETLAPAHSGTSDFQRIQFKARQGHTVVLDGGTGRLTDWTLESGTPGVDAIYARPYDGDLYGLFQDDFDTAGPHVVLWNMAAFNQYESNPDFDLHAFDPEHDHYGRHGLPKHDAFSQYKYADGVLRVRTRDARSPDEHDVRGAARRVGLWLEDRHYITVQGLKFRHFRNFAYLTRSTHIRIEGCDMRYAAGTGLWLQEAHHSRIRGSIIQGCGSWIGHYDDGFNIKHSDDVVLEENEVSYGGHGNLFARGTNRLAIRGNTFRDSGGSLLTLAHRTREAVVESNTFARAATTARASVHRAPHAGIQFNGGDHCVFRRNVIYGGGYGISMSADGEGSTSFNRFEHNVIFDSEEEGLLLVAYPEVMPFQMMGNDFVNNIIAGSGTYEVHLHIPDGPLHHFFDNRFRSNIVYGPRPLRLWELNRTVAGAERDFPGLFWSNFAMDPGFIDPVTGRFELRPSSMAIDSGTDVGDFYLGLAPDIGAFEMAP